MTRFLIIIKFLKINQWGDRPLILKYNNNLKITRGHNIGKGNGKGLSTFLEHEATQYLQWVLNLDEGIGYVHFKEI